MTVSGRVISVIGVTGVESIVSSCTICRKSLESRGKSGGSGIGVDVWLSRSSDIIAHARDRFVRARSG
jgi:hypothetical protein